MELIEKGAASSVRESDNFPGINSSHPSLIKATSTADSFGALLHEGKISEALQLRLLIIEREVQNYRVELEQAKITSALVSGVGWILSANPLIALIAGGGMIGYCYVVGQDLLRTGQFCPLPLTRINGWELFAAVEKSVYGAYVAPVLQEHRLLTEENF